MKKLRTLKILMLLTAFISTTSVTAQRDEKCIPVEEWAHIVADLNSILNLYKTIDNQKNIIDSLEADIVDYRMLYDSEKLTSANNKALYESCKEELESKQGLFPWIKDRAREIVIFVAGAAVGVVVLLIAK